MKSIKSIINKIKDKNVNNNTNNILSLNSKDIKDPFFEEFESEIINYVETGNNKLKKIDVIKEQVINENKNTEVDLRLLSELKANINQRIDYLINLININLFKKNKLAVKNFFLIDILNHYKNENILLIKDIVNELIDNKFNLIFLNPENRNKTLLYETLNKILKDVDNFFNYNKKHKLDKMSILQKKNLIKFFLISINKKYLDADKNSGKINRNEYDFLKEKIRLFVIHKYNKVLEDQ